MSSKKALKGFCGARLWPVTCNDANAYTTGTMMALSGAQALTKEVKRNEYTIYADDGVFDSGADYQYEDLTLTLAELPLEAEAALSGGTYDAATGTYHFKNTDIAPEYALGYAALLLSGQYRMYKHYSLKLLNIKADHTTRGEKGEVQAYKLTLRATQRERDGMVRTTRDSTDGTYGWLDSMEALP